MIAFRFNKKDPASQPTGFWQKLQQGLRRSRSQLGHGLGDLLLGKKQLDDDLFEAIESQLLMADVGIETTQHLLDTLTTNSKRRDLGNEHTLYEQLKSEMITCLKPCEQALRIPTQNKPFVVMMVGINGAGKTTTLGKLAKQLGKDHKVMMAAGDTFRAAAVAQLQHWGEQSQIPVISQGSGADSAAVIFDALQAATARGYDVLLADTAGRLHTQSPLMAELQKIKRVMQKMDPDAPHEVLLVLDASIGQNALQQVEQFHKAMNVTGLVVTKLDGTAKGGMLLAIAHRFGLPIRYIGVGEGVDDLMPFDAESFVDALMQPSVTEGSPS